MDYGDEGSNYVKAKIIIVPVPYDKTSTWIKGANRGPEAILEASANMELYDIETDSEVYKTGIHTDKPIAEDSSPEKMVECVKKRIIGHLKESKFCVLLGGEHSVSLGSVLAHKEQFKDLSVLQLDAHSDLRDKYNGSKYNHASVMARIKEICPIVQVGIRSMDVTEKDNMDLERIYFMKDIVNKPDTKWIKDMIDKLSGNVYVTIDLDVFDPAVMSSTGTPEPGGFLWYEVLDLLREVIHKKNVVGFDVVELCPNPNNKAPDFLAAKLIYKILSYRFYGVKK